ncbi:helicase-exonuclease AddAB subunit AddA [Thermocaproicibacter melissae]|uniref:helicase-exonuclease AddAB subunit AddA n=1 Tax=Thermocaproicibacter melissae TaxID=2966552 RepID=UPI0024B14059|nr:helicase-exonuclease AddAB subunit AddA [Thermocaproicibacter melissae]WBY64951.1 helicase-exonuclease AddAB subunit AddA [Thermocaproicibacter melissae]
MSRNWTPDQQDAIQARGGTLLVSAAAGSGKTAVLVQRAIERITDKVHPTDADRLLVVTFTKAAAAEMRGRIDEELSRLLEKDPYNPYLQRQQLLLSHAHISTVDSFCLDLVRRNFYKLNLPPDIRILDDSEISILRAEASAETLEEFYESGDAEFFDFVESFSSGRDDAQVAEIVERLYDFVRSHPFPKRWLAQKAALYENNAAAAETVWGKTLLAFAADAAEYCEALIRDALSLAAEDEDILKAYGDALRSDLAQLKVLREAISAGNWDDVRRISGNFDWQSLKRCNSCADETLKKRVRDLRDNVKSTMKKIAEKFSASDEQCREDIARLCPIVKKLFEVTERFSEIFDKKKKEHRAADYSDIEHWALNLLVRETEDGYERTAEAEELSSQFDEIMIDEYQDTNETQDMIFTAVSRNGSNLFMVGDVKQSIYRFRQAMPQIFLRKREEFPLYNRIKDNYPACIVLDRNFRSRAGVTDAVNFVFSQLMSRQAGEMEYTDEEKLVPQAEYPPTEEPAAELDVIDLSASEDDKTAIQAESRRIAELIYGMMDGTPRITDHGKLRPACYRDFCVLLRSANRPAHEYVKELTALGIPAWADTSGGFFDTYEAGIALSLLQTVDNPIQDIPLLAVMMSPLYGFTADDMAKIRQNDRFSRLYPAVVAAAESGNKKASDFLSQIETFRTLAASMPSDRLIREIFERTGLFEMVQAMPNGDLRLANLRLLLQYAKNYEASGYNGLSGFLRFLSRLRRSNGDLSAATSLTESANVVRVMSIHHSKGLEFPVCIVAGCAHKFNRERSSVLLHPELGLGAYLKDEIGVRYNTMPREAVSLELLRDDMSEELRVLYVAMTRAREKLILLATLKDAEKTLRNLSMKIIPGRRIQPYVVRSAASIADWLLLCALRHPDGRELRSIAGVSEEITVPAQEKWEIKYIMPEKSFEETQDIEEIPEAKPNPELVKKIEENLSYRYPYAALSSVSAKEAVSQIAGEQFEARFAASSRPAFLSEKGLTPAERGTALHAFMQFADYEAAAQDPQKELERLVAEKFITQEQADAVDLSCVKTFLNSSLMKRIAASPHFEREVRFTEEIPAGAINPELPPALENELVVVQGAADLLFEEDGELVLVDFKTDHTEDADALWERYRMQLKLYSEAFERSFGKRIKQCLLYSFHLGRQVTGKL